MAAKTKKYVLSLIIGISAITASALVSAENYCLTRGAGKKLAQAEQPFIRKQLKAKGINSGNIKVQYAVKEIPDSVGGPEFTCAGKVVVTSKTANAQVLSYDIVYTFFIDEGMIDIYKEKTSRKNISN